jgi:hypothetical protein
VVCISQTTSKTNTMFFRTLTYLIKHSFLLELWFLNIIYTYIHTHTHIYIYTHTHIHMHVCTHTHGINSHIYMCTLLNPSIVFICLLPCYTILCDFSLYAFCNLPDTSFNTNRHVMLVSVVHHRSCVKFRLINRKPHVTETSTSQKHQKVSMT